MTRFELPTDNNKTIEGWSFDDCDPITDSGFEQEVTWKGVSLGKVQEEEIRVLFRLDDSAVFAIKLRR